MQGLIWAIAVGTLVAWAARLSAGLNLLDRDNAARATLLGGIVAPGLLPGASVFGLLPALWLSDSLALRSGESGDRRVAFMLAAAVIGILADPRVAPAGAVAVIAAARHLLAALSRAPANDNAWPPLTWRVSGYA